MDDGLQVTSQVIEEIVGWKGHGERLLLPLYDILQTCFVSAHVDVGRFIQICKAVHEGLVAACECMMIFR